MKKILIIGSCGAGKSMLAEELSRKMDLPLICLDQYYWKPGWVRTSREEWRKKVAELVKKDKWVMDGNYQSTFDIRIPASDAIILLDINRFICFWRIWKRRLLNNRIDKLDDCCENVDFGLMKWVLWDYPRVGKKEILEFLKEYNNKKIVIIKSKKDFKNIEKLSA